MLVCQIIPTKNESCSPALDLFQIADVSFGMSWPYQNINNLEQVQRWATRFILGRDYSEHRHLSKLNLLPLHFKVQIILKGSSFSTFFEIGTYSLTKEI